jgi:hypothetical protein
MLRSVAIAVVLGRERPGLGGPTVDGGSAVHELGTIGNCESVEDVHRAWLGDEFEVDGDSSPILLPAVTCTNFSTGGVRSADGLVSQHANSPSGLGAQL